MISPPDDGVRRSARGAAGLAVLIAAYAAFLLHLRPLQPFEWDEVLFMRAAQRFDVADYSPHAPGYPVYVAAVRAASALASDPQLANQLAVIGAALALMAALAVLVRRLGGSAADAAAAIVVLAVTPAFAFNANVGLSDVPGAALGVAAVLALVAAWDDPGRAWLAAAVVALAAGARPQVVAALLPAGAALLLRLAARRRWGALAASLATGAAVSVACWLPVVLLTGFERYRAAVDILRTYVRLEELGYRLPRAPLDEVVSFWLGRPFGAPEAAVALWSLAAVGTWWWWRAGRRRLVLVAGSAAVSYMVLAAFTLNFTTAVRYVIPALPFVAVLAAGNLRAPARALRPLLVGLLAAWCLVELAWGWRVYSLRRTPAPVWSCLEWVAERYDPERTTVVYHGLFAPHAEWVLGRRGFDIKVAEPGGTYDGSLRPHGTVVVVYSRAVPGTGVVHGESWRSGRLERLTRDRYYACAVAVAAEPAGPVFSTDFQVRAGDWELWDIGVVRLGAGQQPAVLEVAPLDGPLYAGGAWQPGRRIDAGRRGEIVLLPGPEGEVVLRTPRQRHVHLAPLRIVALSPGSTVLSTAFVVPGMVHGRDEDGGEARSDLLLVNPQATPLPLTADLLPDSRYSRRPARLRFVLTPGSMAVADVLAHPAWGSPHRGGALLIRADSTADGAPGGRFFVAGRRSDASAGGEAGGTSRWLRGVPLSDGLAAGHSARLRGLTNDAEWGGRSGAVSLCSGTAEARWAFVGADGRSLGEQRLVLEPAVQNVFQAPGGGRNVDVVVTVTDAPPACLVFPFAVMEHLRSGTVVLLPADPEGPRPTAGVAAPSSRR